MKRAPAPAAAVSGYLREFSDSIARLPGARSLSLGHLRAVFSGGAMFNRVYDAVHPSLVTSRDAEAVARLALQESASPVWILDAEAVNHDLASALEAEGFSRSATWTGMWRGVDDLPIVERPYGIEIEDVADAAGLRKWAALCAKLEGFSPAQEAVFTELFLRLAETGAEWTHCIGSSGGEPVATASLLITEGVAALDWVNTRGSHRRRGIAGHLASRILARDRSRYKIAVLTSTPAGESLYRSLGFNECSRIEAYRITAVPPI